MEFSVSISIEGFKEKLGSIFYPFYHSFRFDEARRYEVDVS